MFKENKEVDLDNISPFSLTPNARGERWKMLQIADLYVISSK
jgi:hypothetical protein